MLSDAEAEEIRRGLAAGMRGPVLIKWARACTVSAFGTSGGRAYVFTGGKANSSHTTIFW